MGNENADLKKLQDIMPTATITVEEGKHTVKFDVKFSPPISEKEHDALMPKIRAIFYEPGGNRLIERFTEETGLHFKIYAKKKK